MSENGPGRSWKLLEGSRSFRAVPPTTPRPYPWGASHLGCPGRPRRWGAPRGGNPPPGGNTKTQIWQVSGGKVWEVLGGLGVQVGLPTPLIAPQGPLGHLYNVGEGWGRPKGLLATYIMWGRGGGAAHLIPKAYAPPSLPLN